MGVRVFNSFLCHSFAAAQVNSRGGEEFESFANKTLMLLVGAVQGSRLRQPANPYTACSVDALLFTQWKQPVGSLPSPVCSM